MLVPGAAIAQKATPEYGWRLYGVRGPTAALSAPTGTAKSAPTPAPQTVHWLQEACSARPPLNPGGSTAGVLG